MPEQSQENKIPKNAKRTKKRVWLAAIVVAITVLIVCLLWFRWNSNSVDERLAAIEAARAIPDSQNAAIIYNQLLEDYDESTLSPDFLDENLDNLTSREPWLSKDYPELAEWLKDQQDIISTLLEASKKEKCRFPISTYPEGFRERMGLLSATRRWAFLLIRAANNDIAEGRIDTAIQKYRCLIQMGEHLCQQPVMVDYLVGIALEAIALSRMKTFILEGDATEAHLKTIEAALPHTENNWSKDSVAILEVERLYAKKEPGFFNRLMSLWQDFEDTSTFDRIHEQCLRLLANRRGNRILISLRRYKNKNDRWPQTLSEIKSSLSKEILIDPLNEGSFVYKLTGDTFKLYSKGLNNIDEDGKYRSNWPEKSEPDDWLIWP